MHTDMVAQIHAPKVSAEVVAANTIQGILAGQDEILADPGTPDGSPGSQYIQAALTRDRRGFYQNVQHWNGQ